MTIKSMSKRWWFWSAAPLIIGGLLLLAFCWSQRVWSMSEWRMYQAMDRECHAAWRDYHYGQVQPGDPVAEVIVRTKPVRVKQTGRWVVLNYQEGGLCFTGLTAVAYDGKTVYAYAWSCTWTRQFFDVMSTNQRAEFFSADRGG
jgi:hypothetical protein